MDIMCRECNEPVKNSSKLEEGVRVFHPKCYTEFLNKYKEYGIRIGMRVHKK